MRTAARRETSTRHGAAGGAAFLPLLVVLLPVVALGDVKLPGFFSDHMVLQAEMAVPVWGWADPGEKVTVTVANQTKSTTADPAGNWRMNLDKLRRGAAVTLVVEGKNTLVISDVLVGEVWLCAGQSNMALNFAVRIDDREKVLAEANDAWVRQFTVIRNGPAEPTRDAAGVWRIANKENLQGHRLNGDSAVGYFFSRELRRELNCPVGMINASVGATMIQTWSPGGRFYNGMIHPVAPYAMRGAIWYQGESNLLQSQSSTYAEMQRQMVAAWRQLWGQGDFPFYYVQIAPLHYSKKDWPPRKGEPIGPLALPEFWEAQTAALALVPNSGMAVIHDSVTDLTNIHPANKQVPGRRLALLALAKTYGRKDLVFSGPVYHSMHIEGPRIRLRFTSIGSGLTTRDGQPPSFFEVAGEDRKFVPAEATIANDAVLVGNPAVPKPVAVRLGWIDHAQPNLMNKEGLPVWPFRTDRWDLSAN